MNTIIFHAILKTELSLARFKNCHVTCVKVMCQKLGCANSNANVKLSMEGQDQKS